ncbi:YebC/PmpR family DNA-binding transcriptional regulator [Kroppenstedtia pulmonis]|uniref:Probable transcriptional regulatory protein GXN76_06295 n=1 Tax=Kroppenstedtia pulmonis TaxID=1380685 RepID=A0A7D3Y4B4_9BACL|nr:YebC/PmpR family DNA-binding transcriptional regulator [Kroppenstedtia pulmonis]QKG84125.1 YebC/PmpR family DNA-binding transcriptional regulator [Kroppenstedtia pulmonis]
MAGHSKWKNIQHRKGRQDAIRGKVFAKLSREITVAARDGSDPDSNQRLRLAIAKARAQNMPNDNIDRAIKKGSGGGEGDQYEGVTYEGYGPGGVAVMVEALTDNRNRTAADIRHIFSKRNGNMGEAGCVGWMFERKGLLRIDRKTESRAEDDVMMEALEAGAEDFEAHEETYDITTSPDSFEEIKEELERRGFCFLTAEVTMLPSNSVQIVGEQVGKMLDLMEALEDHDDVQNVYTNFDADEKELERYG